MAIERICPHCAGDLSHYEDPLAMDMMAEQARELATEKQEHKDDVDTLHRVIADRDKLREELIQAKQEYANAENRRRQLKRDIMGMLER
jgi:hypothetical protein